MDFFKNQGFPIFEVSLVNGDTVGPTGNVTYVDLISETQAIPPTINVVTKYVSKVIGAKLTVKTAGTLYEIKLSVTVATKVFTPAPSGQ